MSRLYNYFRDGELTIKVKPTVINCNTLKVFSISDVELIDNTEYTITILNMDGSILSVNKYHLGDIVQLSAPEIEGYYFVNWAGADVVDQYSVNTTYIVTGYDETIQPNYDSV